MQKSQIIGVHSAGHDTGACLWENGHLLFSVETERLTRNRHDSFVAPALEAVRAHHRFDPDAVELVALSTPVRQAMLNVKDHDVAMKRILGKELHAESRCALWGRDYPCLVIAHEAAHAAMGLLEAEFTDDTLILVNEGRGVFSRNALLHFHNGAFSLEDVDFLPWYGTGFAWSAFGARLGFGKGPSVAGKVMALSGFAHAGDAEMDAIRSVRADLLEVATDVQLEEAACLPLGALDASSFDGNARMVNALQRLFTAAVGEALAARTARGGVSRIALSGGCALNIITNAALRERLPVALAIPPACNDAGQALGAAIYAQKAYLGRDVHSFSVYANGEQESADSIVRTLCDYDIPYEDYDPDSVAADLAEGKVAAFFRGVSEIGPRALGNRSILADPSKPDQKKKVSEDIKKREWFRPLAPIMREETFSALWPDEPASPYMLFNYDACGRNIDGAMHVDGTARAQTVAPDANPAIHDLLERFEAKSGVPALINTSLNAGGRPIALTCRDVLDDFYESLIDVFVFQDVVVRR